MSPEESTKAPIANYASIAQPIAYHQAIANMNIRDGITNVVYGLTTSQIRIMGIPSRKQTCNGSTREFGELTKNGGRRGEDADEKTTEW